MTSNTLLLSTPVTLERLSWIEESVKFFFVQLYPEILTHPGKPEDSAFVFLLTGDSLYSLSDPELQPIWNIILSFGSTRIICDKEELDLRGLGIGQLAMKFPDQVSAIGNPGPDRESAFWKEAAARVRQTKPPLPATVGWLQTESPYMHRSAYHGLRFLSGALEGHASVDLYAYLDGVHIGHNGQAPADDENIGGLIEELDGQASAARLQCHILACNRNAAARGYSTWNDGKGIVFSTSAIRPFRIRELNQIIDRFRQGHVILSPAAMSIRFPGKGAGPSFDRAERSSTAPPVTILITKSPYSTEVASGAISLAVAAAHGGILTRVVFMEEGIYALTGTHRSGETAAIHTLPDLINLVAGSENLHFFAFTPSLQKRGVLRDRTLNAVLEIGYPGLGKILFFPPANVQADHQRVLIF